MTDPFFTPFDSKEVIGDLPIHFTYPFDYEVSPISLLAVKQLQKHLLEQKDWVHNFGLIPDTEGAIIGKMFGVLVVKTQGGQIGYLAAFSGKLAGGNIHPKFVPPVYDALVEGSFLNVGMQELTRMGDNIKKLQNIASAAEINALKEARKKHSQALQEKLFDQYVFLNKHGEEKSIREIFKNNLNGNPPSGAGECATPKLLQYAFQNKMQPIAMAEFWWGLSPKSDQWKHKHFYPACDEKCRPILGHMLEGVAIEEPPKN
ncbi:pseudouridylate synthase [Arcticibacterium luteifluviistationis]|uniref:Pseudouridylate synthase n=1 Tax=Arcticibacterium luteifluviistationis TaxID=1784714 RepID=A0A2Z4GBY8_9BACT|nr:pseudouridylate synthase [Arcticibacterium luteifluviistationis]AWV98443.1 pseudouridylate synthase [Arcticibacterium luteifluviistationis]